MKALQVKDHQFPSGVDWPIVVLRARVSEIARRLELQPEQWQEDGLGPATGMFLRLPSGKVVLICELEHAVRRLGVVGPTVSVDAGDLGDLGVKALLTQILEALHLSDESVEWRAPNEAQQTALDMLRKWRARQKPV